MKRMTNQEVFDKVASHLLKQGKRAGTDDFCMYRQGDLQCAVGCLIPDSLYIPEIDNHSEDGGEPGAALELMPGDDADALLHQILWEAGIPSGAMRLLKRLQNVHDQMQPSDWRRGLRLAARDYKLSAKVLG